MRLQDDNYCFVCGSENPIGLGLRFEFDGEVLRTRYTPLKAHQGFRKVVHGGLIATVLDECMAQVAIRRHGKLAATAELSVRLKQPLYVGQEAHAEAVVIRASRRLIEARAELRRASDNVLIAVAVAKLIPTG